MRYKIISSAVALLLLATPVFAQKSVPILTQTLRTTEPTTVITGQTLKQTYVVKFIDLTHKGEEIIVQKDVFEQKFLGEFEVVNFEIDYETKRGQFLEHYWYVNYTFKIINEKKGPKILPSFVVPWKLKKTGQQENDPAIQINYDLKTENVHLNYVSTIPEKDPYLVIRDWVDFGTFKTSALVLWSISWFLAVVPMSLWLVALVLRLRSAGARSQEREIYKTEEDKILVEIRVEKISLWKARRRLRKIIKKLRRMDSGKSPDALKLMSELYGALMVYLRLKVSHSTVGTTGTEMPALVEKMKHGPSKLTLAKLADKAICYQSLIEEGKLTDNWPVNPVEDARQLLKLVRALSWYMLVINYPSSRIYWS